MTRNGSGRIIIGLIVSLSIGMVPLTLQLVKQELIDRAGSTVALGAADIAGKLDMVLAERLGDIQAFAQPSFLPRKDPAEILPYLEELHRVYPIYQRLSMVDREGRLIVSTDRSIELGEVVSSAVLLAILRRTGHQVEIVRRQNQPGGALRSVRFLVPLYSPHRELEGAIISEIDRDRIRSFVTQTTQRKQVSSLHQDIQEFLVLDPAGDVLLTSDEKSGDMRPMVSKELGSALVPQQGDTGYIEEIEPQSGRNALTGYARMAGLPGIPDLQWRILVRVDRAEVLQSIWTVLWKLVGIGELCLLPLLALFYWSRHRQSSEEHQAAMARKALEANEARIRKIVDIALDAVVIIDAGGAVTEWNPQAEKIFGFSRQEALGTPLTNLIIPAAYREAHMKGLQRYVTSGQHAILNRRIAINALHKEGHELPVELTIIPLHIGEQLSFCAFLRDIAEQKRAEEELRGSKAFLDSVVDNLPTMVFIKDAKDLRFVRLNKAGEALIGCSQTELVGKSDYDLFPPEQADFFTRHDRAVLDGGRLQDIAEEPIETKHKGVRFLHTKKIPILDAAGRPRYLLGISEDITEQRRAEELMRRSREAAEAANKAKSEFLANVSHEIRTPLNAVLGALDLLSESATTKEQQDYATMGKRAGSVLLRLVNDLLDIAKVEAGALRIETRRFELAEIVRRAHSMMALRAQTKGLRLAMTIAEDVPAHIEGDATRLQQVLLNLIGNAIKFTERGHVTLSVSLASPEMSAQGLLLFSVADSGIGIPSDQFDTIFERFTQIDSGDNRKYGGAGLGLSICRQLVKLMGGRMWVESELGQGSRFLFTMRYRIAANADPMTGPAQPDSSTQLPPPAPALPVNRERARILFVDDFPETLQLANVYLQRMACQLDVAESGTEAIARCRLHRYDLVLMDMQMPEVDGYAATAAIRAWEQQQGLPPVPIVAVTADVLRSAQERSTASGCTGFLGKPFTKAALVETVRHYLDRAQNKTTPERPMPPTNTHNLDTLRRTFITNRRQDIAVLATALAAEDFATIATLGHRIKGLAGSHGLDAIGHLGAALEQAAAKADRLAIEREIEHLKEAMIDADKESGKAA